MYAVEILMCTVRPLKAIFYVIPMWFEEKALTIKHFKKELLEYFQAQALGAWPIPATNTIAVSAGMLSLT